MNFLTYLIAKKVLPKERCRILDLGTSILMAQLGKTPRGLGIFPWRCRARCGSSAIDKVVNSSVVVAGIRTAYLYELLELVPQIEYLASDVAPNAKTMPFDLTVRL
jgi:hypothetical protein